MLQQQDYLERISGGMPAGLAMADLERQRLPRTRREAVPA